jgi:hypothetical protein
MGTPGAIVLDELGRRRLCADGRAAVFDAAGNSTCCDNTCRPSGNCYDHLTNVPEYFKVILPSGKHDRAGKVAATWGSFDEITTSHNLVAVGVDEATSDYIWTQVRLSVQSTGRTLTHDMILGATDPCSVEARAADQGSWAGNWALGGPVTVSFEADDMPSSYVLPGSFAGTFRNFETRNFSAAISDPESRGEAFVSASASGAFASWSKTQRVTYKFERRFSDDGGATWSGWTWQTFYVDLNFGWSSYTSVAESDVAGPYTFELSASTTGSTSLYENGVSIYSPGALPARTVTASIVVSATSESPSQLVFHGAPPRIEVSENTSSGPVVIEQLVHPCETVGCINSTGKAIESRIRLWTRGSIGFYSSARAIERLGPGGLWFYRPPGTGFYGGFYYLGTASSPVLVSAPVLTTNVPGEVIANVVAVTPLAGDCCADESSTCRPCRQCLPCASAYRVRVECVDGGGAVVETVADVIVTQTGGSGKPCQWIGSSAGKTVDIRPTSTTAQDRLRLQVFVSGPGVIFEASQPSIASAPCCPVASSFTSIDVPYTPPAGSTLRVTID